MKIQWFGLCFCLLVFSCGEVGGSQGTKSVEIKEEKEGKTENKGEKIKLKTSNKQLLQNNEENGKIEISQKNRTSSSQKNNIKKIDYDTTLFRFLPLKEQLKKSTPFHEYETIKLKRYDPDPTFYSFENKEEGYMVIEQFPGVLHYRYKDYQGRLAQPYTCYSLEFYNPKTKKLIKKNDLKKDSPYRTNKYNIIGYGYPAMEDFSLDHWAKLEGKPVKEYYDQLEKGNSLFLTVNNVNARPNGFTIVEFQLIKIDSDGPINWEETLLVFDSNGNEVNKLILENDTQDSWTSDDGRFLAFIYGGSRSYNPLDTKNGGIKIYDFDTDKYVYHKENNIEKVDYRGISLPNYNYLNLPRSPLLSVGINAKTIMFSSIDFTNRLVYTFDISKKYWKVNNKKTVEELLDIHPFTIEEF